MSHLRVDGPAVSDALENLNTASEDDATAADELPIAAAEQAAITHIRLEKLLQ